MSEKEKIISVEIQLRDYLQPNGRYPYESLAVKMDKMNRDGEKFHLLAVHGGLMGTNYPDDDTGYPFSNMNGELFRTAADLLSLKNGKQINDL